MTGSNDPRKKWRFPLWLLVLLGILASTLTGGAFFYLFAWQQSGPILNFALDGLSGDQLFDSARTTVALVGIVGLGGAAFIGYRRQRSTEEAQQTAVEAQNIALGSLTLSQEQFRHDEIRTLRERYTAAAEQLGSESFAIRLAGVYAFASLADDWAASKQDAERQVCIDVLCAYLRTPTAVAIQSASGVATNNLQQTAGDLREAEVRDTIIRIIGQRTLMDSETESDGPWQDCKFDLSGAQLPHIRWASSRFNGLLDFTNATFDDGADFSNARLRNAKFTNAEFRGNTNNTVALFKRTQFTRATFYNTKFLINARFPRMIVTGTCDFTSAEFRGPQTDFAHANYEKNSIGTTFDGATFTGRVSFASSWWRGPVSFRAASFETTTRLDFYSPREWTVPPTVDWNEHSGWPESLRGPWPPKPFKEVQAAAEQEATNNPLADDAVSDGEGSDTDLKDGDK